MGLATTFSQSHHGFRHWPQIYRSSHHQFRSTSRICTYLINKVLNNFNGRVEKQIDVREGNKVIDKRTTGWNSNW